MNHLDEMACLLYLEGQLERSRAQELSAHVEQCGECRTLLRALDRESRLLTRSLLEEDEPVPARLLSPPGPARNPLRWAWVISFGLAATGAYALYTGYIEPWQQQLEQAGFGSSNLLGLLLFQGAFWKGWQSVITMLEILAMLTVGGVGLAFLRRRFRRWTALAVVVTGLVAAMALPAPATAAETRHQENVTVGKDEVVHTDLFVFTDRARIEGTVEGDVFLFTESADVSGHVTGDVIAFAQSLRISGQVDGNVRGFVNNATVTGTVGRNWLSFLEWLALDPSGKINGSVTTFAKRITLEGRVGRDLLGFVDEAQLRGPVRGGFKIRGRKLEVGPAAEIRGQALFEQRGKLEPVISPDAKFLGGFEIKHIQRRAAYTRPGFYIWKVIGAAAAFLFGLVLMFLVPQFSEDAVKSAGRYGASFGVGALMFFGVPLAAIIACVTVVGLGVGISTIVLWCMVLYAAQVVVGAWLGEKLLGPAAGTGALLGRMALGVVIIRIVAMVPYLGGWLKFAVLLWGMGAVSLAIYKRLQRGAAAAPGAPVQAPLPA